MRSALFVRSLRCASRSRLAREYTRAFAALSTSRQHGAPHAPERALVFDRHAERPCPFQRVRFRSGRRSQLSARSGHRSNESRAQSKRPADRRKESDSRQRLARAGRPYRRLAAIRRRRTTARTMSASAARRMRGADQLSITPRLMARRVSSGALTEATARAVASSVQL